MMIVLCHVYSATGYPYIALNWVATILDTLYGGIPLFFVLSGFCLYYPLTKPGAARNWRRFFARRVHRLLPPYYAAIAIVIALPFAIEPLASAIGLVVNTPGLPSWTQFWTHLLLLHTLSTNAFYFYGLDSTFWTLPIEWQFYLLFPLAVWMVHRWRWRAVVGICAAALAYRILLLDTPLAALHWPVDIQDLFLSRWSSFALGMLVARRLRETGERPINAGRELADLVGALCLFLLASYFMYGPARQWPFDPKDMLYGGFFSVLLYLACLQGSWCGKFLSCPPLVWLGTISYSLYLVHYPVLFALTPSILALHLSAVANLILVTVIGVPVAIGAAALFYQIIERHFLKPRPLRWPSMALARIRVAPGNWRAREEG